MLIAELAYEQREAIAAGGVWAVYQNEDMSSINIGEIVLLKYGSDCTHKTPPRCLPDGSWGAGWRYVLIGVADAASGQIVKEKT